jgi:hypothetical protein
MAAHQDDIGTLPPRQERSVAGLFGDLGREASRLFRQEIALAKAELVGKLGQAGGGAAEMAAGGLIAFGGYLALLAAAVMGLSRVVAPWLAALIVGVVAILVGGLIMLKGKHDVEPQSLVPGRTLRTLRDDAEWAREQMR